MAKSTVRTRLDIIKQLSEKFDISTEQARNIVRTVLDEIVEAAIEHGKIEIRRFGTFKITRRAARVARNPRTNQQMKLPPRYVLTFDPSEIVLEKVARHYHIENESDSSTEHKTNLNEKQQFPFNS